MAGSSFGVRPEKRMRCLPVESIAMAQGSKHAPRQLTRKTGTPLLWAMADSLNAS